MVESLLIAVIVGATIAIPVLGILVKNSSDTRAELRREVQMQLRDITNVSGSLKDNFVGLENAISEVRKELVALRREIEEARIDIKRVVPSEDAPKRIVLPQQ
jgi:uncharacterized protein (DUF3084 family)